MFVECGSKDSPSIFGSRLVMPWNLAQAPIMTGQLYSHCWQATHLLQTKQ